MHGVLQRAGACLVVVLLACARDVSSPNPSPQALRAERTGPGTEGTLSGLTILDLGTLGGAFSDARSINDEGQVVGESRTAAGETHAFLWHDGTMIDLGTLGGNESRASAVNSRGQIVGSSRLASSQVRAFLWQEGTMTGLGTLGGKSSGATDINRHRQVVGSSQTASGQTHAFLWQDGAMNDLGTLGGDRSEALGINDRGQVVGVSEASFGEAHAFLWERGTMIDLGVFAGVVQLASSASAVNGRGQVVGNASVPPRGDDNHAVLWARGTMTDLGTLGGYDSDARAVSDGGRIVGSSITSAGRIHAFLWERGGITDLGTLAGDESEANAINDRGQVAGGSGTASGEFHAVLWTKQSVGAADLDVTYIDRTPRYSRYVVDYRLRPGDPWRIPRLCAGTEHAKRWPDVGEVVTYTAHVMNKGSGGSRGFGFEWLVNGRRAVRGKLGPLDPGHETTVRLQRTWPRAPEPIEFRVDPQDRAAEAAESNNSRVIGSHDLTLNLLAERGQYDAYDRALNLVGSRSFEDWIQTQVAKMNERFAQAKYPVSPDGILDRARIDKIVITAEADGRPDKPLCGLRDDPDEDVIDGGWTFSDGDPTNVAGAAGKWQRNVAENVRAVDFGLIHELAHQLGVPDLYRMNLARFEVRDLSGEVIPASRLPQFGFDNLLFGYPGIMAGGDRRPYPDETYFESHTAGGLNSNYQKRRGYFGEYFFDTPGKTHLTILDAQGNPIAGARVQLYQKDAVTEVIDDIPEIEGTTDASGSMLLVNRPVVVSVETATGHTLRPNPFGQIFHEGQNGTMFVRAIQGGQELYGWMFVIDLNLAYWEGHRGTAEIPVVLVPPRF